MWQTCHVWIYAKLLKCGWMWCNMLHSINKERSTLCHYERVNGKRQIDWAMRESEWTGESKIRSRQRAHRTYGSLSPFNGYPTKLVWRRGRHTRVRSSCCDWVYKLKPALDKASVTCLLFTKSTIGILKYEITGKRNCVLQVFSSFEITILWITFKPKPAKLLHQNIIIIFVWTITRL